MDAMTATTPPPDGSPTALPEGGRARAITRWGEPVMHRPADAVTSFDDELRSLAADMVATMRAADGVGLAACQIGVGLAIFVFDCPDDEGRMVSGVVCNPTLRLPEGKERRLEESYYERSWEARREAELERMREQVQNVE